jgi:hypothetical protein
MDDPRPPARMVRWLGPLIALTSVVAVILTLGRVVAPVPAFLGAALVTVVLGVVAFAAKRPAGIEVRRPGPGAVIGVLLWIAAVGAFLALASAWSDFGTP